MSAEWKETHRQEIGVNTSYSPRSGATFTLLYRVTECRKAGRRMEWREYVVPGATLYQAKTGLIGSAALLEVVAKGVKALAQIARREDEAATSRRKRR